MYILTSSQSRELDQISSGKYSISGKKLMENAGKQIAKTVKKFYPEIKDRVLILCGKGNNGGDGFASALHLKELNPIVSHMYHEKTFTHETAYYFNQCKDMGINVQFNEEPIEIENIQLTIDSILGIGVSGDIRKPIDRWIDQINKHESKILSVDIPTGINADTGWFDMGVKADKTITMGFEKTGMSFYPGRDNCGEIIVSDIGFPKISSSLSGILWEQYDEKHAQSFLQPPPKNSYKHSRGKVLVIGGSVGMSGAAILCASAALKSGAGLVKMCIPESLNTIIESSFTEAITVPCRDSHSGILGEKNLEEIEKCIEWCDSIIIGPGMGIHKETIKLIDRILKISNKPTVVDADALTALSENDGVSALNENIILTPHFGELARLMRISIEKVKETFISKINLFMSSFSGTLVLKSTPVSVINNSQGYINISGNQGLASAGTGDVLSGCIGGFLSQKVFPIDAAKLGVFIHGKAADNLVKKIGFRGMTATDVLNMIPKIIKDYELKHL